MISFFGDFDTSETVVIPFNTFGSSNPSASVTITNLAATDIHIHKDGGAVQRSSASGVAVTIDFDSITGNHICTIDLSDNTDAGFYADGSQYQVRMEGTTVDAATINAWIGAFSIGRMLRPTTAGRTLDVTATGAAGIDWGNVENPTTAVDLSGTDIQLCDTVTTNTDMRGTDSAALASVVGSLADAAAAGDPTSADTVMQYIKQLINILVGTTGITTWPAAAAPANGVSIAEALRAVFDDTNSLDGTKIPDTLSLANINAEVDTALATTTYAEPGQGAPAATATLEEKISYLYKSWRNLKDNDGSTTQLYNDAGTTVDQKQSTSESGGTVTKAEWVSGP